MKRLAIAAVTEMGSHIYTEIKVSEDYTMNEVVAEIRRLGYVSFRIVGSMKAYARV